MITGRGGGLHPDMVPALLLGFLVFTLLTILLVWARARAELDRQRVRSLELEAASAGLTEEPT